MTAINIINLSSEEINKFVDSFDTILTDCDGKLLMLIKNKNKLYAYFNIF